MCGIAGVYLLNSDEPSKRTPMMVNMLLARLQNRGDLSTGMARYNPSGFNRLEVHKGRGTVKEFFGEMGSYRNEKFLDDFKSVAAIGHNRYATSGQTNDDNAIRNFAQPYVREHNRKWKEFTFCFNGNINNDDEIKQKIMDKKDGNYYFKTDVDTEMIKIFLSLELNKLKKPTTLLDFKRIFATLAETFDGAYNILFMDANGHFIALRDPMGFHPLSYAVHENTLVVSGEDSAIRGISIDDVHEVPPGYFIYSDGKTVKKVKYATSPRKAHCIFEYVYFMNAASTFGDRLVQRARGSLGYHLAKAEKMTINDDMVTAPVPGTAIGMCDGYQHGTFDRTGKFLPRFDALVKVSESRSFIADFGYHSRHQVIRGKFDLTPHYLEGKELILVDDSIVRGSTSKQLIQYIREQTKATKVHMRVAAAPSRFPCFYGINMPTLSELIASNNRPLEEIRKEIGADSLAYNTVDDMVRGVAGAHGLRKEDFCLGCFTGRYPTPGGNKSLKKLQLGSQQK